MLNEKQILVWIQGVDDDWVLAVSTCDLYHQLGVISSACNVFHRITWCHDTPQTREWFNNKFGKDVVIECNSFEDYKVMKNGSTEKI